MSINLHQIVRRSIHAINSDESAIFYRSAGQKNDRAKVTPIYEKGLEIEIQVQPLSELRLIQLEGKSITGNAYQAFLYSSKDNPVKGMDRRLAKNGDFLFLHGAYYLITAVLEDWSHVGWVNVEIVEQMNPPDFSESEWWEG